MSRPTTSEDLSELRAYSEKLRSYSTEELEDVYFHIDVLRQPMRYNLVKREMEARKVHALSPQEPSLRNADLHEALAASSLFLRRPGLTAAVVSALLTLAATSITFLLLAPIWLFAIPLHFLGYQTAIVYLLWTPVAPVSAVALSYRLGGRGVYLLCVLLGLVAGALLFNATGAPAAIIRSISEQRGGSGGISFGGF